MLSLQLPSIIRDAFFLLGYVLAYLTLMALLRGILLSANIDLADQIPRGDLIKAFFFGLRFDLIITCIVGAPLVLALLSPAGLGTRRVVIWWLAVSGSLTVLVGVAEIEFYREFHARLNSVAFHYLAEDAATVSSMLWHGYPILRYLALWLLLSALYISILVWINRLTLKAPSENSRLAVRIPVFLLVLFLSLWGGRGTLRSGPPLRWGDAYHSQYSFANHLALNGTYTLAKAAMVQSDKKEMESWSAAMPEDRALDIVRAMMLTPTDELLQPNKYSLLRHHTPQVQLPKNPENVVFIIMESFSAAFTGAISGVQGITPAFDKLAAKGLLFDHFFSNGTHTHQGMFASLACFPNLPGHEYLMQQSEGQHSFSGLPALLKPAGFDDVYVYNGDFAWDNQEGFFRNQGMSQFVGRGDYVNPVFSDPTWGVSDEDMFNRSLQELNHLDSDRPFFAVLQTLSNHLPYAVPENLAFEPIINFGRFNDHLTAQRYSDSALGEFFESAAEQPWFNSTLFVVVGDHGFALDRQLTDIDLLRFHVPLLIMAPGIQATYGDRNHTVATQIDIVPTIVSLLGKPFTHQCWGRDILGLPEGDPGFGMIKPSGSDHTVALIQGNRIVIKPPGGQARSGTYSLYPNTQYTADDPGVVNTDPALEMAAFIQTALQALVGNRTGV